jgi:hypothetical protein
MQRAATLPLNSSYMVLCLAASTLQHCMAPKLDV